MGRNLLAHQQGLWYGKSQRATMRLVGSRRLIYAIQGLFPNHDSEFVPDRLAAGIAEEAEGILPDAVLQTNRVHPEALHCSPPQACQVGVLPLTVTQIFKNSDTNFHHSENLHCCCSCNHRSPPTGNHYEDPSAQFARH